jgi:hypothetical protein
MMELGKTITENRYHGSLCNCSEGGESISEVVVLGIWRLEIGTAETTVPIA